MSSPIHVALDLETLGIRPGDAILSIGAVYFDPVSSKILSELYMTIDPNNSRELKFTATPSTIQWWQEQPADTRTEAFKGQYSVESALVQFRMWLPDHDNVRIWGNGSDFDNALLGKAYTKMKQEIPWKFYHNRCFRTLLQNLTVDRVHPKIPHHALEDARAQAMTLCAIAKKYSIPLR